MRQREKGIVITNAALRRALVSAVALALLFVVVVVAVQQRDRFGVAKGFSEQIDRTAYQAVFLTGGQTVFFGRATVQDSYLLLSDVFYLSPGDGSSPAPSQPGQLIKRGRELHGPREPMIIPIADVLFIENLRDDGEVAQAIRKFKAGEIPAATPPPALQPVATPTATPVRPSPTR